MRNETCEYLISVGGLPLDSLIQERAYSHEKAINRANGLSLIYPQSDIVIEEWKFITSDELFVSGLYRGATTIIPATRKEVNLA
ncbi:MAG: hypothetical protein II876_00125 [Synergistaceae bacterium]|nr:hypothetical protein [Synergistaceae bacterium]MBQ3757842.1 hypothetical protein [Synergistaceae bacterium]MBQ6114509.1 hypothetical protein [Synergistaceae bacterium]MBR0184804.1 hypothetical protein [Synergistaceae bacterium]MBR0279214.1 hypothetical protein [Synergistaceae bacterium]